MKKPLNSVKAISVVGGASMLNVTFGIIKMKVAAIILGPAGVGLIGLIQQLMVITGTLFSLGIRDSGTRQIAGARANQELPRYAAIRHALLWGTLVLAIIGSAFFFLLRGPMAKYILDSPLKSYELGWVALGVALTIGVTSQQALLNGLRQVRELAIITLLTGALSAAFAISALFFMREIAVLAFVLSAPFLGFVLGAWFVSRLPALEAPQPARREIVKEFQTVISLGLPIMLAALVVGGGQVVIRTLIQSEAGLEALGLFTAAWLLSQNYIFFLLAAITLDYYPRLTEAVANDLDAVEIINEQTEISLLFAAPLLFSMMALGPYLLLLLYSSEFVQATGTLRWLILGDVLRIAVYPLDYALLAYGMSRTFLLLRTLGIFVFILTAFLLIPYVGIIGAGMGYFAMHCVYPPIAFYILTRRKSIVWNRNLKAALGGLVVLLGVVGLLSWYSNLIGSFVGGVIALTAAGLALKKLRKLSFSKK